MYKEIVWFFAGVLIGKFATAPKSKEILSKSALKASGMATEGADYVKKKSTQGADYVKKKSGALTSKVSKKGHRSEILYRVSQRGAEILNGLPED